jgi:DNA-binding HxlR family transcriptional regulator
VLSERLSGLVAAGLVLRTVDEGPPVAVTYRASESGLALMPALEALTAWARNNLPERPPV